MKIKNHINCFVFIATILFMTSCKEGTDKNKQDASNPSSNNSIKVISSEGDSHFYLTLRSKFNKWDKVHMYYRESEYDDYSGERKIEVVVEPNGNFQDIKFELKKDIYPYNIRIDLGENIEQSNVIIEECVLSYGKYNYSIKGKDLNKYFHFNQGVEITSDSSTFLLKTFKRNNNNIYDPFIRGKLKLSDILNNVL